jgi:hypothetical protein
MYFSLIQFDVLQASDRKLAPPRSRPSTPRELLMESIKKGRRLKSSFNPLKKKREYYITLINARDGK